MLSAGQPTTPQEQPQRPTLAGVTASHHTAGRAILAQQTEDDDEDMVFWGGHSPRGHDEDMHAVGSVEASDDSDDEDEDMETLDDDEEGEDDEMALFGHR